MLSNSILNTTTLSPAKKYTSPNKSLTANMLASRSTTNDSTFTSPIKSRVQNIEKRIGALDKPAETVVSPVKRTEDIEVKIRQIDARIVNNHAHTEDKLKIIVGEMCTVEETLDAEKIANDVLQERIIKEMTIVESNLALDMKAQHEQDVEAEKKMLVKIESQIQAARTESHEAQYKTEQYVKEHTNKISERVYNLQKDILTERKTRETFQNDLTKAMNESLTKINHDMITEREICRETENFLLNKIEEVCSGLQRQVDEDKEKRQRSEEQILQLLEECCTKFEIQLARRR